MFFTDYGMFVLLSTFNPQCEFCDEINACGKNANRIALV
jgi:hypothetical protein